MQINRRLTSGLAWAGLFVVVAVPVADAISGQFMGGGIEANAVVAEAETPVPPPLKQRPDAPIKAVTEAAAKAPAKPAAANTVVDNFLSSGKKLPSYITDGDAPVAAAPPAVTSPVVAPTQTAAPQKPTEIVADPVTVAALPPQKIAPMPMPLAMRPAPVTQPLAEARVPENIVLPPDMVARDPAPVVVDDLEEWESGPLSDFLARRQGQRSSAEVNSDGFFLSDGPNRRQRRDIYVGPADDEIYYRFGN